MTVTIGQVVQLVLTIAVPLVPMGYRRYYRRRAAIALDKLRSSIDVKPSAALSVGMETADVLEFPDSADRGCVSRGDPGFWMLETAVRERGLLSEDAEKFCLAAGDISEIAGSMNLTVPNTSSMSINAVFYVSYSSGKSERLIYHPNDFHRTAELIEANQWVRYAATTESESITIFLAFLLFAVTVLL